MKVLLEQTPNYYFDNVWEVAEDAGGDAPLKHWLAKFLLRVFLQCGFQWSSATFADTARFLLSLGERTPRPIGRLNASLQRCCWSSDGISRIFELIPENDWKQRSTSFAKTTRTSKPSFFEVVQITFALWKTFRCRTYLIEAHIYVFGRNEGQWYARLHQSSNFHLLTI